ncbi:hypothetical protein BY996DRAFT_6555117 [Phakopsora pachyrhizi]|nr:hypothetical protein BY996DRAFT_6555117 [Phakopsora pachyrhizi]
MASTTSARSSPCISTSCPKLESFESAVSSRICKLLRRAWTRIAGPSKRTGKLAEESERVANLNPLSFKRKDIARSLNYTFNFLLDPAGTDAEFF